MHMFNRILGSLLVAATSIMFSATAHADSITVCLDTYANGASLSWAGTSDQVRVGLQTASGWVYRYKNGLSITGCNAFVFDGYDDCDIFETEVSINGDNMVWIDQVEIFYTQDFGWGSQTSLATSFGADNTNGWCVSSDANDYKGYETWCTPNVSTRTRSWNAWFCL